MTIDDLLSWWLRQPMARHGGAVVRGFNRRDIDLRIKMLNRFPDDSMSENGVRILKDLRAALHRHRATAIVVEDLPAYELAKIASGQRRLSPGDRRGFNDR